MSTCTPGLSIQRKAPRRSSPKRTHRRPPFGRRVTIGNLLRRAGYEATALGKTHYYDQLTREFDRCVDLFEHEACMEAVTHEPTPPGVEILGPWRPFFDPASVWLNSACLPYDHDASMPDTFFTELAVRHLLRKHTKPFFLWVGFYVTHSPFRFPIEYRGHFDSSSFAVPEVAPEDADRIPPVFRNLTNYQKRVIAAAYYTSVEYMDRNVGLILDTLDSSGRADGTLVVFKATTDTCWDSTGGTRSTVATRRRSAPHSSCGCPA